MPWHHLAILVPFSLRTHSLFTPCRLSFWIREVHSCSAVWVHINGSCWVTGSRTMIQIRSSIIAQWQPVVGTSCYRIDRINTELGPTLTAPTHIARLVFNDFSHFGFHSAHPTPSLPPTAATDPSVVDFFRTGQFGFMKSGSNWWVKISKSQLTAIISLSQILIHLLKNGRCMKVNLQIVHLQCVIARSHQKYFKSGAYRREWVPMKYRSTMQHSQTLDAQHIETKWKWDPYRMEHTKLTSLR